MVFQCSFTGFLGSWFVFMGFHGIFTFFMVLGWFSWHLKVVSQFLKVALGSWLVLSFFQGSFRVFVYGFGQFGKNPTTRKIILAQQYPIRAERLGCKGSR